MEFKKSFAVLAEVVRAISIALLCTTALLALALYVLALLHHHTFAEQYALLVLNRQTFAMPIMLVFSTITAGFFAAWNIKSARETVRLQETLQFICRVELDREFIDARTVWSKYRDSGDLAALIAAFFAHQIKVKLQKSLPEDPTAPAPGAEETRALIGRLEEIEASDGAIEVLREDAQFVLAYLNQFEIIGLGINEDIVDKDMYDAWLGTHVVQTWNASAEAIGALQAIKGSDKLFVEWRSLVLDWARSRGRAIPVEPLPHYSLEALAALALDFHDRSASA